MSPDLFTGLAGSVGIIFITSFVVFIGCFVVMPTLLFLLR